MNALSPQSQVKFDQNKSIFDKNPVKSNYTGVLRMFTVPLFISGANFDFERKTVFGVYGRELRLCLPLRHLAKRNNTTPLA
jgi:hypothetical protein